MSEPPPPEGVLLRMARESVRPRKLSMRAAARLAGVSETHWRNAESGREMRGGVAIPVRVQPDTLARMAAALDVTAEQLKRAGREDAAAAMRDAEMMAAERQPRYESAALQRIADDPDLTEDEKDALITLARRMRSAKERHQREADDSS